MMVLGNDGPWAHGGLSAVGSAHGGPSPALACCGLGTARVPGNLACEGTVWPVLALELQFWSVLGL